jgi:uncharacterized lipoprotein YmbA
MKTSAIHVTLFALAIASIAGCGSLLAPQPDRSHFFVLSASADSGGAKPSATALGGGQLSVGVGPVRMPDYLQRPGIATRLGPTQVEYSQVDRWAEPLDECFPRVLAQDLSASLSTNQVALFPWPGGTRIDYQVQVDVERFEVTSQGQAVLAARWTIKNPESGASLASGDVNESRPAGSGAASATAALSRVLGAMADTLAARISLLSLKAPRAERKESAAIPAFRAVERGPSAAMRRGQPRV